VSLAEQWSPHSPKCAFQRYLYMYVGEERAPWYRPPAGEDEARWTAALATKPGPGWIPVRGVGFEQLGVRVARQLEYVAAYRARLHQISASLTQLLQRHDLGIAVRAAAARRRHAALSRRCLVLAARAQVLRLRGFPMAGAEEELKRQLLALERRACDPALAGRAEEVWARMVGVRARARELQEQLRRSASQALANGGPAAAAEALLNDEGVMKKAAKVWSASHIHIHMLI
jgi:nuclear pore complex protein Nup54